MRYKFIEGEFIQIIGNDNIIKRGHLTQVQLHRNELNLFHNRSAIKRIVERVNIKNSVIVTWDNLSDLECSWDHGVYNVTENNLEMYHIESNQLPKHRENCMSSPEQHNLIGTQCQSVDGVPIDFVSSFGTYIGLKFFLEGVDKSKNVFTYAEKNISAGDFEVIKSKFLQCRTIYTQNLIEYEFYQPDFGYVLINKSNSLDDYTISISIGYDELNEIIKSLGRNIVKLPKASWVTGIDSDGDLIIKNISIKSIHKYNEKLYPFMKGQDINDFVEKYLKSKSSILILIGPPGTSKTNFIRQLLTAANESVLLTYSEDLKKADRLFSHFYDSPEKFLIIEDADTYISARTDGNSNMKQLLNITDGLTANPDKKVVFTTNLPNVSSIDSALLRPGRCYTVLQFNPLTGENLHKAAESIDEYLVDKINLRGSYTVAELYAVHNDETVDTTAEVTHKQFGFTI